MPVDRDAPALLPVNRIVADAAAADEAGAAGTARPTAADLLDGEKLSRGWADPRSRASRITACLDDLTSEREAAGEAARAAGQDYLDALAAGTAAGRPPAQVTLAAQQIRVGQTIAAQQGLIADWETRRAAATGSRLGRRPVAASAVTVLPPAPAHSDRSPAARRPGRTP